jgi:release factor glutamine methyltransferase
MSEFATPLLESTVVAALRTAGCVFAEDEARLLIEAAGTPEELAAMVARRADGLPLEHVVGWAEFAGLRIAVDPGVFVPRRRTEFLVQIAAGLAGPGAVVVDLCCGSGAVGVALATALGGGVELHAADLDPVAVRCARRNAVRVGGRVHEGDLFAALPADLRGRVRLLAANVPYVPTGEVPLLPPEAREHEAPMALDGGADGLDIMRRVAARAPDWLAPGGSLLVESSERQAGRAADIFTAAGLLARVATSEELYATVIVGTRPPTHRADPDDGA